MMTDFHFLRPEWLLLLPVLAFLWWRARRQVIAAAVVSQQIAPHLLAALTVSGVEARKLLPQDTLAVILLFAVLGVAGPAWRLEQAPWFTEQAPLVVAVRVADSMRAGDLQPSRLERARFKVEDLLDARTGARTALMAYAGSAHIVMPPTKDVAVIKPFLESLDPALMPTAGDNVMAVLELAAGMLEADARGGTLLLVTDRMPATAADDLAAFTDAPGAMGVVVLLVGTEAGGAPLLPDGSLARDDRGAVVDTRVDLGAIRPVARRAGIPLVRLEGDDGDIRELLSVIASNEARAASADARYRDDGWWLVWPALLIALVSFRRGWVL